MPFWRNNAVKLMPGKRDGMQKKQMASTRQKPEPEARARSKAALARQMERALAIPAPQPQPNPQQRHGLVWGLDHLGQTRTYYTDEHYIDPTDGAIIYRHTGRRVFRP
jgi:hypothetical protein